MMQFSLNHFSQDGGVGALRVAGAEDQCKLTLAGVLDQFIKERFAGRL